MAIRCVMVIAVATIGTVLPLIAADGMLLATSGDSPMFNVHSTDNATFAVMSQYEIAYLLPVTWRKGETVTVTKWDGTETTLVASAASAGAATFTPDSGGVWTLVNSAQGTARVGVAWSVYDDGGTLAVGGISEAYGVDSLQSGPDRKTRRKDLLPVAYSGDNWRRDMSKAATLTFIPPEGEPTVLDFTGTGVTPESFTFDQRGVWIVRLTMADSTVREAIVKVKKGFVLSFH